MPAWITWLLCVLVPMPGRGSRSSTHTLRPCCATASAAESPTTPPPITAVSICSIEIHREIREIGEDKGSLDLPDLPVNGNRNLPDLPDLPVISPRSPRDSPRSLFALR